MDHEQTGSAPTIASALWVLPAALVLLAAALAAMWLGPGLDPRLLAVAVAVPLELLATNPRCYVADDDGLTLHYCLAPRRHYPASHLLRVDWERYRTVVRTRQGRVVIASVTNRGPLTKRLEAILRARDPEAGAPLDATQVGDALGLAPAETIRCARSPWARLFGHWLTKVTVIGALSPAAWWLGAPALTVWLAAGLAWLLRPVPDGAATRVLADVNGLSVSSAGAARDLSWSDLREVQEWADAHGRRWQVWHNYGYFVLTDRHSAAGRLIDCCRRAIALREEGQELAEAEEVPDGALSLTGDPAPDERGLSIAADEPP